MSQLVEMMGKVEGYRVEKSPLFKTAASAEGWSMKAPRAAQPKAAPAPFLSAPSVSWNATAAR